MGIGVRLATVEDAHRIAEVHVIGWRTTYADLLSAQRLDTLSVERYETGWRRRLEHGADVRVATLDESVVAFANAGPARGEDPPRDLELYAIYQLPQAHGSGTGQAVLDAAIGDRPCFLWVADPNPRAQAFYRRNGFVADGTDRMSEDLENLREVRMTRPNLSGAPRG